jgi:glycosyltransferase involved in cell wall biosynthesis
MRPVRVLMAHNYYQQAGGEDNVFSAETLLLRSHGHEVLEYTDTNKRIDSLGQLAAAKNTVWSDSSYQSIKKLIKAEKPDIAHFHNTFFMISPSVYYACHELGVPVVQSLHNYRLTCPSAIFYRDHHACEDCLGKFFPWPGVLHKCYRGSAAQSLAVAFMLTFHHLRKTWVNQVNAYITSTDFSRTKMIQAGLPAERIFVKPNFSHDVIGHAHLSDSYTLTIGRLSPDKGVAAVLQAWETLGDVPLKITGDGEMRAMVEQFTESHPAVNYLGFVDRKEMPELIQNARFLVFASQMYEVFPMVIAEAYAAGIPVIASRLGAMTELIREGETGLLFNPGDAVDLAAKVRWLWDHPEEAASMGQNARREYEQKYSPEQNYQLLMEIYEKAIAGSAR